MAYGYGTNSPFGLKPSRGWDGTTNPYYIASGYATSLYKGDPVVGLGNGTIGIGVTSVGILGVFWGCNYINSSGTVVHSDYWPANTVLSTATAATGAIAYVIDDPFVLFDIQVSNSTAFDTTNNTYPTAVSEISLNANASFVIGAGANGNPATGSTVTGLSGYYLDYSTINTTNTLSLKILQLTPFINNSFNAVTQNTTTGLYSQSNPFNNVIVQINNHVLKGGPGTLAV